MVDRQEIPRDGITCVYAHPDAQADIVFLHGLNGNPTRTWTAKDSAVYWPVDLLPNTLGPDAPVDVLVYGYNADTASTSERSASDNYIYEHAQTLVTDLTSYRGTRGTATRPIIWVAHSLGGILLKRALNYSNDLKDRHHEASRSIFVSTFGIIFLGTPHKGSGLATWGSILQNMARATMPRRLFDSEPVLIKTLKKNNQTLRDINVHFLDIYQRFKIQMAHENHKTDFTITKRLVVDSASANPELPGVQYFGIEATHSNMCKFSSSTSHGYRIVTSAIREWVIQGPSVIERRWDVERNESRQRAIEDATERLGPAAAGFPGFNTPMTSSGHFEGPSAPPRTTPSLSTPFLQHAQSTRSSLFITPSHFHPDTVFVGRDKELAGLHTMLLDEHRRSLGTSAVVVQGMSGIGKSALGKQYIFNHKSHYPGGIYWIRASTLQEMEDDFWHIAKNDAIRQMIDHRASRRWQSSPQQPAILELGLLSVSESQELLLGELGKHKPYKPEDLDMAAKLVKLMDCLPLMIHSAAQQMKATREPLSKYLKSWKAKPHIGDAALPAFQSIRDDLQDRGETAALNLINILSFFGQLIPVEMLALGLKALDTRTSVKTKGSLNKTFATLIAFALIERSETAEIRSLSSKTSDNSGETQTEPLDTLWTHSVTQVFFANILADDKQSWLERAIAVFCRSFDEADARMKSAKPESKNPNKPGLGMPDDYRRYSAHGKRLLEHVNKMKKTQLAPELNAARRELRLRLESIPAELDRLQRAVLASIVNGDEAPRISGSSSLSNSSPASLDAFPI
ncbi:Protein SERAC1 like protein [Verticillium longisporum]|uniref:Protein SERAC1 like protein n=1 Tax=Verticillium longisporum TaxID=100787 RepID=A0A8I2Z8I1_VERLO|nr:Protein SERAC1 like protein [Verticillium longisporum]